MLLSQWMLRELDSEATMTRALLAHVPQDKLDWSPPAAPGRDSQDDAQWSPGESTQSFHTIRWNASHLVEILGWLPTIVRDDAFNLEPVDSDALPHADDIATMLQTFDGHLAAAREALRGVSDAVMDGPWSLKMNGQVLFTMKKGECLQKWVFSHTAHHRGILTVYLRMAGVKVPSVYES